MRRILLALIGVVALSIGAAPAVSAGATHTYDVHGVVLTTGFGPVVTSDLHPSTFTMLGRVSLDQSQESLTVGTQSTTSGPFRKVPAAGYVHVDAGTLTSADGHSTVTYSQPATAPWMIFLLDYDVTAPNGLHPVDFEGDLTVTGGTGRFAGATGTLHFAGTHSFVSNQGLMVIDGTLVLPS